MGNAVVLFRRNADRLKAEFYDCVCKAVERRCWPHGKWHRKDVAYAIGRDEDTLGRWIGGETKKIPADAVYLMCEFFAAQGDAAFIVEVWGGHSKAPAELQDRALHAELRNLKGGFDRLVSRLEGDGRAAKTPATGDTVVDRQADKACRVAGEKAPALADGGPR